MYQIVDFGTNGREVVINSDGIIVCGPFLADSENTLYVNPKSKIWEVCSRSLMSVYNNKEGIVYLLE